VAVNCEGISTGGGRGGVEPLTFRFSVGFGLVSVLHCASVRKATSSKSSIHVPLWIMMLRYVCEKTVMRLALFHKSCNDSSWSIQYGSAAPRTLRKRQH
jgi:hypothetical protein